MRFNLDLPLKLINAIAYSASSCDNLVVDSANGRDNCMANAGNLSLSGDCGTKCTDS